MMSNQKSYYPTSSVSDSTSTLTPRTPRTYNNNGSKSFYSLVTTPYRSIDGSATPSQVQSVGSPYTSLGSGPSSYASIHKPHPLYGTLRAKAEKANAMHESKSKAVMQALKGLQDKIQRLEVDRTQAESNLRSLANETKDYKDLLRKQQNISGSPIADSSSKNMESKLDKAQGRCEVLEKQLEHMRNIMLQNQSTSRSSPPTVFSTPPSLRRSFSIPPPISASPPKPSGTTYYSTVQGVSPPKTSVNTCCSSIRGESPAIAKLNDLEREHLKLTASQSMTEGKIRELEGKIHEERHHRKLLQDKANQLQSAMSEQTSQPVEFKKEKEQEMPRKIKKRKKSLRCPAVEKKETIRTSSHRTWHQQRSKSASSADHYLLDLQNIPFVVGQSTGRSHSLGANIQNILSIMKSHNNLCTSDHHSPKHRPPTTASNSTTSLQTHAYSNDDLNGLLSTLQDEFAQLGFEHREISSRLTELDEPNLISDYERELERVVERMETKGKQIHVIRDHIKTIKGKQKRIKPKHEKSEKEAKNQNLITVNNGQEVEVVTTIRTKDPKRISATTTTTTSNKVNSNREMLRNVQKLQTTLRKDDLKWL